MIYLFLISASMVAGYAGNERSVFFFQRRQDYPFWFFFLGFFLCILSGVLSSLDGGDDWKELHYYGSVMAIILGFGNYRPLRNRQSAMAWSTWPFSLQPELFNRMGPRIKLWTNWKGLYVVTFLIFTSSW